MWLTFLSDVGGYDSFHGGGAEVRPAAGCGHSDRNEKGLEWVRWEVFGEAGDAF